MYVRNSFGWSKCGVNRGEPDWVVRSGINVTVIAAVCCAGVVVLSVVNNDRNDRKQNIKFFMEFLLGAMEKIAKKGKQAFVMDDEDVANNEKVQRLVKSKCVGSWPFSLG
jgi:hypothetical protein